MGDVIFLSAYRIRTAPAPAVPVPVPVRRESETPHSSLAQAGRALSESVLRMQAASRQLAAASADLLVLARGGI